MLRIATYYESALGRNDGNPLYVFASLKRMQEKGELAVDHLRPVGNFTPFGTYDLHVWVDWGEDGLTGLLPYEPVYPPAHPLIYWASDTHIHEASYKFRLERARQADLVFCAQKRAVDEFRKDGVESIWLPHAVEPRAYSDHTDRSGAEPYNLLTKKYDICFVGHVNSQNRVDMLDRAFREFPNFFWGQRLFNEAARKYAESKICLNISMTDDINMRCFEVMGSRSLLLTNWIPTIEDLFTDGKHLVLYRTLDEMVDKIRYYLDHDEERERIARAGYTEVMLNHTIDHRVKIMLEHAKKLLKEEVHV